DAKLTPHGRDLHRPSQQIKWRNVSHDASCKPGSPGSVPLAIMRDPANSRNPQAAEPRFRARLRFDLDRPALATGTATILTHCASLSANLAIQRTAGHGTAGRQMMGQKMTERRMDQ